jgi:hypothetical protein
VPPNHRAESMGSSRAQPARSSLSRERFTVTPAWWPPGSKARRDTPPHGPPRRPTGTPIARSKFPSAIPTGTPNVPLGVPSKGGRTYHRNRPIALPIRCQLGAFALPPRTVPVAVHTSTHEARRVAPGGGPAAARQVVSGTPGPAVCRRNGTFVHHPSATLPDRRWDVRYPAHWSYATTVTEAHIGHRG